MTTCACGQPLWALQSQERGFCEHCRLHPDTAADSRTHPYELPPGFELERR